ncbi:MAG: OmpA family protein [Rickettsiales bacterium]|nr:OmpA family protein [Rickettsiales bacterium]
MKNNWLKLLALMVMIMPMSVLAAPSEDAAYDKNSNSIVDQNGKCVRTKWMGNEDPCAPKQAPVPVAAPAPAPQIFASKDERTIYFDFNKAELTESEKTKLNALAKIINDSKRITDVRIVGYTDQFGTDSYNQKLSNKRVDAVTDYLRPLIRLGITPEKSDIRGAGKAPTTECKDVKERKERIACMKEERRVEIVLNRQY